MDESNKRLRQARKSAGFKSARGAAIRFGWKTSTYASHENGQTEVPKEDALKYAKAFKVDPAWILNIEPINHPRGNGTRGDRLATNLISVGDDLELDDLASVPEMDTYGGAGSGGFNQEENTTDQRGNTISRDAVRATWGIPAPFLRSELHIRAGSANIIPVRGDSMKDALFDGDRAIINLDDVDVSQGGIFALLDDSAALIIKQVEIVRGSKSQRILCTSRNPVYTPFELDLVHPVKIVGRVAGKITRL